MQTKCMIYKTYTKEDIESLRQFHLVYFDDNENYSDEFWIGQASIFNGWFVDYFNAGFVDRWQELRVQDLDVLNEFDCLLVPVAFEMFRDIEKVLKYVSDGNDLELTIHNVYINNTEDNEDYASHFALPAEQSEAVSVDWIKEGF